MLDILDRDGAWCGMQINVSKTKILTVEEQGKGPDIHHMGQALEEVESSLTWAVRWVRVPR